MAAHHLQQLYHLAVLLCALRQQWMVFGVASPMRSAVASPSATVLLCVVLAGSGNSADPLFDTSDERNYDIAKDLNAAMEERLLQGQYAGHLALSGMGR